MVEGLFRWLGSNGFKFKPDKYHFYWNGKIFDLKTFLKDEKGDCEDISALYQICCNSQGINMGLNKVMSKDDDNPFPLKPVKAFDGSDWNGFLLHQVGIDGKLVFDPTLRYETPPNIVNGNMTKGGFMIHNEKFIILFYSIYQYILNGRDSLSPRKNCSSFKRSPAWLLL